MIGLGYAAKTLLNTLTQIVLWVKFIHLRVDKATTFPES